MQYPSPTLLIVPRGKLYKRWIISKSERWTTDGGYRQVLVIAIPLILSTGAWSVQHFVDRMFLSWYSPETIAAAMPAGILSFTVMSLFIEARPVMLVPLWRNIMARKDTTGLAHPSGRGFMYRLWRA
ncbi:hypothetical protein ACFL7M_00490 [Thermodesulfobacteriota bacterium]